MISRTLLIAFAVLLLRQDQANAWWHTQPRTRPRTQLRIQTSSDSRCTIAGGKCMSTSNHCVSNNWRSGLCGGPSSRRCCLSPIPGSSGTCTLVTYKETNIRGINRGTIRIDQEFRSSMDKINGIAQRCGVTVVVTSSFRKNGMPVGGAIVLPASRSNHKVGHAIDMNLETEPGWCNSACLAGKTNRKAKCFTDRIQSAGLRWGGNFRTKDPVHIDDRLNLNSPSKWKSLYKTLQRYC